MLGHVSLRYKDLDALREEALGSTRMWCWQRMASCGFDVRDMSTSIFARIILSNVSLSKTNLAIGDSGTLFRLGVRNMVRQIDGVEVIGSRQWEDLTGLVQSFTPDVVVVMILSEGFDIDVVRAIKASTFTDFGHHTQQSVHLGECLEGGCGQLHQKRLRPGSGGCHSETSKGGTFCGQILDRIRQESIDVDDLETLPLSFDPIHSAGVRPKCSAS